MSGPLTIREHELWLAGAEAMRADVVDSLQYVIKKTQKASLDELKTTETGRASAIYALTATLFAVQTMRPLPPEVES